MGGCAAPFCNNSSQKGYIMKIFPKNLERRALWTQNVSCKNWAPTKYSCLCEVSNHVLFYYNKIIITILIKINVITFSKIYAFHTIMYNLTIIILGSFYSRNVG